MKRATTQRRVFVAGTDAVVGKAEGSMPKVTLLTALTVRTVITMGTATTPPKKMRRRMGKMWNTKSTKKKLLMQVKFA